MLLVYFYVFYGGAALMAIEMLGSRFLAPQLGNSIFVWASLIGVILGALSVGYTLGGRLADRFPRLDGLAAILGSAGLLTWLLPWAARLLLPAIVNWGLGAREGSLLAALVLFAPPALLLGMLSPWAVRLAVEEVEAAGRASGYLYALSTAGSIAGTLGTAFFLIPAFPLAPLTHALGASLVLSAALAFLPLPGGHSAPAEGRPDGQAAARPATAGTGRVTAAAGLAGSGRTAASPSPGRFSLGVGLAALALALLWPAAGGEGLGWPAPRLPGAGTRPAGLESGLRVIYERSTLYHYLRVAEDEDSRYLLFDHSWQSGMYLDDPVRTRFEYTDYYHLAFVLQPEIRRALLIGLGGGSVPKRFLRDYPQVRLDVVELDPAVEEVARRYFALPEDERLRVVVEDGRRFVDGLKSEERYDLIMLDAYYADAIPFHLATREFLESARAHLAPNGVLAVNLIGALAGPRSHLFRSFYRTVREVFPSVYVFP
ncbi:MAG: fused MFS/spermidine synthase, partial [Bacillota bacterium]|nr:fused MFS/spermidine synthase [Bacillota bacterium]